MTKIYNIRIMTDEKDLIKKPTEGQITASSSNVKGKEVERISEAEIEANIKQIEKVISGKFQTTKSEPKEEKIEVERYTCYECEEWHDTVHVIGFFSVKTGTHTCYEYNGHLYCPSCWNGR